MVENSALTRRGPGRPRGLGKVAGSGRKAGQPNAANAELRERIDRKYGPLDFLGRVVLGVKIRIGPPAGPGGEWTYPTLGQRIAAAVTLAGKIAPDLKSSELSGPGGADLIPLPPAPVRLDERQAAFVAGIAFAETAGKACQIDG